MINEEAVVTLRTNKKIAILALSPTLSLTQTLTLTLIFTYTQNQNSNPNPNDNSKIKSKWANEYSLFALLFSLWAFCNITSAISYDETW